MDLDGENEDIAAAMGFSSFSEVPKTKKRKPATSEDQDDPADPDNPFSPAYGNMSISNRNHHGRKGQSTGANSMPLGQPRQTATQAPSSNPEPSIAASAGHPVLDKELEELTNEDLFVLKKGVLDREGRKVYFQKSFIDSDPWKSFKNQQDSSRREK